MKTLVTDACPHKQVPPPPSTSPRSRSPGKRQPSPLAVPDPPIGGDKLRGCGVVVPDGAPPVPPGIDSAGWLVADVTDGTVVAAKDPHGRYRPASTIKLLLAQSRATRARPRHRGRGTPEDAAQEGDAAGWRRAAVHSGAAARGTSC